MALKSLMLGLLGVAGVCFAAACQQPREFTMDYPLLYVAGDEATDSEKGSGIRIKLAKGEDKRTVEVTDEGTRVTVRHDGKSYVFERSRAGALELRITGADGKVVVKNFDSDAELKKADAELHRLYKGDAKIEVFPDAKKLEHRIDDAARPDARDSKNIEEFRRIIEDFRRLRDEVESIDDDLHDRLFGAGDLTEQERKKLSESARKRLKRDLERLQRRERENRAEEDPEDRAEEAEEIVQDRYLASLRATERSLLDGVGKLRKPGGDRFEDKLDDLQDDIKDTFADLRDIVLDEPRKSWPAVLDKAREHGSKFERRLEKLGRAIGVGIKVADPAAEIDKLRGALIKSLKRLRKTKRGDAEDALDDLEEKIYDAYEGLEEKLEGAVRRDWPGILKRAESYYGKFSASLVKMGAKALKRRKFDRVKKIDEALDDLEDPMNDDQRRKFNKLNRKEADKLLRELEDELKNWDEDSSKAVRKAIQGMQANLFARLKRLRTEAAGFYGKDLDELKKKIKDKFDAILEEDLKKLGSETVRALAKEFRRNLDRLQRKIAIRRDLGEGPADAQPAKIAGPAKPRKPAKRIKPAKSDLVAGVRLETLAPLVMRQMRVDHGLSVTEIVEKKGLLAKAGLLVFDVILSFSGDEVSSVTELRRLIEAAPDDEDFTVTIIRAGKRKALTGTK